MTKNGTVEAKGHHVETGNVITVAELKVKMACQSGGLKCERSQGKDEILIGLGFSSLINASLMCF